MKPAITAIRWAAPLAAILLATGCRTAPPPTPSAIVPDHPWSPTGLPMFDGEDGTVLTWADLIDAVAGAEIVVLGEEHDDGAAHRFQKALVGQAVATWPRVAVALEMVERDHQQTLDALLAGLMTEEAFLDSITSSPESRDWFEQSSLPVITAAAEGGGDVVAANAPRTYVRLARFEGWSALERQTESVRALYAIPEAIDQGPYRRRIEDLMRTNGVDPDRDRVDEVLRAQQVWDSTMAESTLNALKKASKVFLVVGRFHGDFRGGTVELLERARPFGRTLYVATLGTDARTLQEADRGRADIVIYTGGVPRPEPPIDPVDDAPEVAESSET